MTDKQILALIATGSCGRFAPSQLDRKLVADPRKPFLFTAVLASFLATISLAAKAAVVQPSVQLSFSNNDAITTDTSGQFISGQVVDNVNRSAITIANIQLKNTSCSTSVDEDGNFRLFIPDSYFKTGLSLMISSPGYMTTEVLPLSDGHNSFLPVYAKMSGNFFPDLPGAVGGVFVRTRWQRFKSRISRMF